MPDYLLGIDNGGTVSKVVLLDLEGREVAAASRKGEALYPRPRWVERDMHGIWRTTAEAIREVLATSGIRPQDVVAVGGTGHGNGLYAVDHAGNPLRYGILAIDSRAHALTERFAADGTAARSWKHVAQQIWPGLTVVLLRWIKDNEPDVYARLGSALLIKDYVKFRLTGVLASDVTELSGTGLLDLWQRAYSPELLDLFGLADAAPKLPLLHPIDAIIGRVTAEAAAETGLPEGVPVSAGIFDISANALAAGVLEIGQMCISAGTWSINEVVTPTPVDNPTLFQNTLYLPDRCLLLEGSPTSASNLEWFVSQFYADTKAEADARGESVFELCNAEVAALMPEGTSILFHPFLFGSNLQAGARAGFYGVAGWHTRAHMLRAVYEGVAYSHLTHVERLRAAGLALGTARLTGGGSRSAVWAQMFADVLQLPIEVTRGQEMGARGAALAGGVGAGFYPYFHDGAGRRVVVVRVYAPYPTVRDYYQSRYAEYRFLADALGEAWSRLSRL